MMKCSKCGAELMENSKFCGECGSKVEQGAHCPECGANVTPGIKFCGECGHKMSGTEPVKTQVKPMGTIEQDKAVEGEGIALDWEDDVHLSDLQYTLEDMEANAIELELSSLQDSATDGRVLTANDDGFAKKLAAFSKLFVERTGMESVKGMINADPIGIIDWGVKGTGQRAVVFTRLGVFYIGSEYPKMIDGEAVGGMIPWKLIYKFGKSVSSHWEISIPEILASNEVDDDVKGFLKSPDSQLVMKPFFNCKDDTTGLRAKDVERFLEKIKDNLTGDDFEDLDD